MKTKFLHHILFFLICFGFLHSLTAWPMEGTGDEKTNCDSTPDQRDRNTEIARIIKAPREEYANLQEDSQEQDQETSSDQDARAAVEIRNLFEQAEKARIANHTAERIFRNTDVNHPSFDQSLKRVQTASQEVAAAYQKILDYPNIKNLDSSLFDEARYQQQYYKTNIIWYEAERAQRLADYAIEASPDFSKGSPTLEKIKEAITAWDNTVQAYNETQNNIPFQKLEQWNAFLRLAQYFSLENWDKVNLRQVTFFSEIWGKTDLYQVTFSPEFWDKTDLHQVTNSSLKSPHNLIEQEDNIWLVKSSFGHLKEFSLRDPQFFKNFNQLDRYALAIHEASDVAFRQHSFSKDPADAELAAAAYTASYIIKAIQYSDFHEAQESAKEFSSIIADTSSSRWKEELPLCKEIVETALNNIKNSQADWDNTTDSSEGSEKNDDKIAGYELRTRSRSYSNPSPSLVSAKKSIDPHSKTLNAFNRFNIERNGTLKDDELYYADSSTTLESLWSKGPTSPYRFHSLESCDSTSDFDNTPPSGSHLESSVEIANTHLLAYLATINIANEAMALEQQKDLPHEKDEGSEEHLYQLQNTAHEAAHQAKEKYRDALELDDSAIHADAKDAVRTAAIAAHTAWEQVQTYCKNQYNLVRSHTAKEYWERPLKQAESELASWSRARDQFDPEQTNSYVPSKEDHREFPFATLRKEFSAALEGPTIRIIETLFKYPLIRIEEFSNAPQVKMVADQLYLFAENAETMNRFHDDKDLLKFGEIISKSDDEDDHSCLFQFNEKFLSKEFPSSDERFMQFLNKHGEEGLVYAPNYLLSSETKKTSSTVNPKQIPPPNTTVSPSIRMVQALRESSLRTSLNSNHPSSAVNEASLSPRQSPSRTLRSSTFNWPQKTDSSFSTSDSISLSSWTTGTSHTPYSTNSKLSSSTSSGNHLLSSRTTSSIATELHQEEDIPWYLKAIHAPEAWAILEQLQPTLKIAEIPIAFIDTGIGSREVDHLRAQGHIWQGTRAPQSIEICHGCNYSNRGQLDYNLTDHNGHGTFCAMIASVVVGHQEDLSSNVKLMICKAWDSDRYTDSHAFAKCFEWACNHGAKIINISTGWNEAYNNNQINRYAPLKKQLERLWKKAHDKNILIVTSAGNKGTDNDTVPHYPSNLGREYKNIVAVAASTQEEKLWQLSNCGKETVHLAAPGADIDPVLLQDLKSCLAREIQSISSTVARFAFTGRLTEKNRSGSSLSSAIVAGALAILEQVEPIGAQSAEEYLRTLLYSRTDLIAWDNNDQKIQHGLLNVVTSLKATNAYRIQDCEKASLSLGSGTLSKESIEGLNNALEEINSTFNEGRKSCLNLLGKK